LPRATVIAAVSLDDPRQRQSRLALVAVAVFEEHHGAPPHRQEVPDMCEEWWMWRRRCEAEKARRLWDEFERTRPIGEPERMDKRELTLEQREATAQWPRADQMATGQLGVIGSALVRS
jgi:hypothetical protein